MSIWYCKIGTLNDIDLRGGADWPMRKAIGQAFTDLTGQDAEFCFSGWSAKLTESELAVVENREPVRELVTNESPEMLRAELAEAEEPVAYLDEGLGAFYWAKEYEKLSHKDFVPLYVHPPRREPLTEEEIDGVTAAARDALMDHVYEHGTVAEGQQRFIRQIARAIERAHGIGKNK